MHVTRNQVIGLGVIATVWLLVSLIAAFGLFTGGGTHVGPLKEIPIRGHSAR
jgi:hypothetical protein